MTPPGFVDTLLTACAATLGWKEETPNWSPAIRSWLAMVGVHSPAPWCVAYTHAMYAAACENLDLKNPHPVTANSQAVWRKTPEWQRRQTPLVGGLVVFAHVEDGQPTGRGHVEIVVEILPDRHVKTIGGNTNEAGSREGNCVASHVWKWERDGKLAMRGSLQVLGFCDLWADSPGKS